ncbi:MAG: hypothetical protein K6F94_05865 [Bacteroidaceae bacterium]|nr:hypothetical protein [Bacteroidaceae bacterium]
MIDSPLFRRIELQVLMNITAGAFGKHPERIWTLPHGEALKAYALYTCKYLREGADEELWQKMNRRAYRTGRVLRRLFFVRSVSSARRLIVALYRNIGIRMSFDGNKDRAASGEERLCFSRCYFSAIYTPAACLAASALDDGIIRGIMGLPSGRLCFSQRISEGCTCCLASINKTNKEKEI